MPIPLAPVQHRLLRRLADKFALPEIGKDATTYLTANVDLDEPIRVGLASLVPPIVPASYTVIVDADFTSLPDARIGQVIDVAELHALRLLLACPAFYDQSVSMGSQSLSQVRMAIESRIKDLIELSKHLYGYGLSTMGVGTVNLGINRDPWSGDCGSF